MLLSFFSHTNGVALRIAVISSIAIEFCSEVHAPHRMNPTDSDDPLTSSSATSRSNFSLLT